MQYGKYLQIQAFRGWAILVGKGAKVGLVEPIAGLAANVDVCESPLTGS